MKSVQLAVLVIAIGVVWALSRSGEARTPTGYVAQHSIEDWLSVYLNTHVGGPSPWPRLFSFVNHDRTAQAVVVAAWHSGKLDMGRYEVTETEIQRLHRE